MREASFAVGCLTRRLDLPAFCIEFPLVVVVVRRIGIGHVKIFLSETINGASSDAPTTDRLTSPLAKRYSFPVRWTRKEPRRDSGLLEQKNGFLAIAHQNADRASSTHRNSWLSLVWLRPRRATLRFASQRQNTQSIAAIQRSIEH